MNSTERLIKLSRWRRDILFFLQDCFPNHFSKPFAPFHREIYSQLQEFQRIAIAAPRNHGKTAVVAFGWVMWNLLCNPKNKFTVIISNNYENAIKYLAPIKHEIEQNTLIKAVFGDLKSNKWSENEIELARIQKKIVVGGNDFKIRGQKYLENRPDLLVLDDAEDDELVRSDTRRHNFEEWLIKAAEPAMTADKNQIVFIGTVLHRASQLSKLLEAEGRYKNWHPRKYTAIKKNGEALWADQKSIEWLQEQKSLDPYAFAQEYMNNPVPYENSLFKEDYFDNYKKEDLPKDLLINITVDLACTDRTYSDYTVIMPVGIDPLGDWWVLPYHRAKYEDPDKVIEQIFLMANKYLNPNRLGWKFGRVGIEAVAFQRFLIKNFNRERKKRGLRFSVVEIPAKGDKVQRIAQLQPLFSSGDIHVRKEMTELRGELLDFPRAQHDDCSDALAMHMNFIHQKAITKIPPDYRWKVTPEMKRKEILNKRFSKSKPKVYVNFAGKV